jgi:transcriptional regulator with XRE-family HTH domain
MARKAAAPSKKSSPAKRGASSNGTSQPFGVALESRMRDKGISYRALAEKTGLSAGYLNHLVHGNRPVPSNDVVETLADSLDVDPEYFREYRLRVITEKLEAMPELVDRLYRRLSS